MSVVLDASAVLALVLNEPGADMVRSALPGAVISTVNLTEVYSRCADRGLDIDIVRALFLSSGVEVHPYTEAHALAAGRLRASTRPYGLSLGDRACLAVAETLRLPVLTADRAWQQLNLGIDIGLVR